MSDIIIIFFLNNIIIFCLLFWCLSFISNYFFKKKNYVFKKQLYECGFKSTAELNIQINMNFSMICIFFILYDIEFIFLFPLFFNIFFINVVSIVVFFFFYCLILFSLFYDFQFNSLNWQY